MKYDVPIDILEFLETLNRHYDHRRGIKLVEHIWVEKKCLDRPFRIGNVDLELDLSTCQSRHAICTIITKIRSSRQESIVRNVYKK